MTCSIRSTWALCGNEELGVLTLQLYLLQFEVLSAVVVAWRLSNGPAGWGAEPDGRAGRAAVVADVAAHRARHPPRPGLAGLEVAVCLDGPAPTLPQVHTASRFTTASGGVKTMFELALVGRPSNYDALNRAMKPACSKSRSYASASVMLRSSMTRKLAQSVRLHVWSGRAAYRLTAALNCASVWETISTSDLASNS